MHKIPLKDVPEEGLIGLNLPQLIDRVIIGPSRFPVGIHDALLALLTEAGVENPVSKIIVSDLPLRQWTGLVHDESTVPRGC
jgi:hypothetical protein